MTTRAQDFDAITFAHRRRLLSIDYDMYTRKAPGRQARPLMGVAKSYGYKIRRQFLPHYFQSPPRWRTFLRQLRKQRVLPDFGVIGTVKSGTTDLAATLMAHPNVLYPLVKEFDSTDPMDWRKFYPTKGAVLRHVKQYGVCLSPFVGPYLHSIHIASGLARIRPNTKIIINLREPSDLVFSLWKWVVLHTTPGTLSKVPFLTSFTAFVDKAIELFPGVIAPISTSLHMAIYSHSVAHWIACFGEDNVRVFDISEYFTNRTAYMQQISGFTGLPYIALPVDLPVPNLNPLQVPMPTSETKAKLREFFEPYNRRLWRILGTPYAW